MDRAASHVFHDQNNVLARVDHFVKPYDMLMPHFLHQLDLSLYAFASVWVHQLVLFIDFHRNFTVGGLV